MPQQAKAPAQGTRASSACAEPSRARTQPKLHSSSSDGGSIGKDGTSIAEIKRKSGKNPDNFNACGKAAEADWGAVEVTCAWQRFVPLEVRVIWPAFHGHLPQGPYQPHEVWGHLMTDEVWGHLMTGVATASAELLRAAGRSER